MFKQELIGLEQQLRTDVNRFVDICNGRFVLWNLLHYLVMGIPFLIYIILRGVILGTIGVIGLVFEQYIPILGLLVAFVLTFPYYILDILFTILCPLFFII